jgi:hypothetical protein
MDEQAKRDSDGKDGSRPRDVTVIVPVLNEQPSLATPTKEIELAFQQRPHSTYRPIGNRPLLSLGVRLEVLSIQLISLGMLSELILHQTPPRPPTSLVSERAGANR